VLLVPQAPPAPAAAAPVDPSAPAGSTTVAAAEPDRKRAKVAELAEERTLSKASASDSAPPSAAGSLAGASAVPHPLQAAAGRGDVEALRRLLADPAARVDTPDADGRTALLAAVLAQQPAAVRLLLEAGADPGRADRAGLTPRAAAQAGANAEIAALLAVPR
jgi:ankyrin repeat protein